MTIIDVREADEFKQEHIEGSINIPLSNFAHLAPGVFNAIPEREIVLMCRGGSRAEIAQAEARSMGYADKHQFRVFPGGILAWQEQGKAVVRGKANAGGLSLMRQVQVAAGSMAFLGVLLGFFVHPYFFLLSGFVGAGLTFAGLTGTCLLASILQAAPWNREKEEAQKAETAGQ